MDEKYCPEMPVFSLEKGGNFNIVKRGRGRPLGSRNKPKVRIKPGRPKKSPEQRYQAQREAKWKALMIDVNWAQYQKLLDKQAGLCAVCRKPPGKRALAVDHDHDTGRIRGLLCAGCNYFLFRKQGGRIYKMARYLAGYPA